jgi:antirestriction protein ArdC
MPARFRFVDAPHYYSLLFHEMVHSTGHESRLHRAAGFRNMNSKRVELALLPLRHLTPQKIQQLHCSDFAACIK